MLSHSEIPYGSHSQALGAPWRHTFPALKKFPPAALCCISSPPLDVTEVKYNPHPILGASTRVHVSHQAREKQTGEFPLLLFSSTHGQDPSGYSLCFNLALQKNQAFKKLGSSPGDIITLISASRVCRSGSQSESLLLLEKSHFAFKGKRKKHLSFRILRCFY